MRARTARTPAAFLRLGREPNLPIEQFFKKVRVVVNDVTEGKQTPWESSSLTSDFYFFGDTAVAAAKNVDPARAGQCVRQPSGAGRAEHAHPHPA